MVNVDHITIPEARELVRKYRPRGWTVRWERSRYFAGIAIPGIKVIMCPPMVDVESAFVFLHECAHVHLGHFKDNLIAHTEEYQCEQWATHTLRLEGFRVSRRLINDARDRVRMYIEADEKKEEPIDPTIRRWAYRHQLKMEKLKWTFAN